MPTSQGISSGRLVGVYPLANAPGLLLQMAQDRPGPGLAVAYQSLPADERGPDSQVWLRHDGTTTQDQPRAFSALLALAMVTDRALGPPEGSAPAAQGPTVNISKPTTAIALT